MKRKHLLFPQGGQHGRAPRIQSRTIGLRDFITSAYRTDGDDPDADPAKKALLDQIQTRVKAEIAAIGAQNADAVQLIVTRSLEGLPLDALRAYEADAKKVTDNVRNIAAELEKIKNATQNIGLNPEARAIMRRTVEQMWLTRSETGEPAAAEILMQRRGRAGEITLNLRAAANMTTTNTINENNFPLEMIESVDMIDEVVKKRRGNQYIFQLASRRTVDEIEEYTTWLEEGNEEGAFAIVAQGAVKPLVSTGLVRNYVKAEKIAGKMVITEEFAKFRKRAWAAIQDLIQDKLVRDYAAILTTRLQAAAASYVGTSLDDTVVAPTDYDAIGAVAAQIETLNFNPDLLIIHPQDKWRLALQKDSTGAYYMMIPMMGADGVTRMMGFTVVTSTYQTIGTATLGESGLFKIEDETITIRLGYGIDVTRATVSGTSVVTDVASDFDTNKLRLIVETFFKNWIATSHAGSFVTFSFATVKAALLKP